MNHPRIVHQWCFAQESAFAEALDRPVYRAGLSTMRALIDRARSYFRQDRRDGNEIFADFAHLATEFDAMSSTLDRLELPTETRWRAVCDNILPPGHHPETAEALLSLLLELFPDIVAHWDARLVADETVDLDPAMTTGQLADLVRGSYSWLLVDDSGGSCPQFWYHPLESPYEPRRGLRGTGSPFETETPMDLPRLLPRLLAALAAEPAETSVGVFVAHHAEFALLARRVQSLAGLSYAELRIDSLAGDFLPFAACRFLLAFYGMEKYDPRLPRSTKGALLQGAPLPEEIAEGLEGDWPFPLAPETQTDKPPAIVPQRLVEQPEIAIGTLKPLGRHGSVRAGKELTLYPAEMRKLLTRAVFGAGLGPVAADAAVRLAVLAKEGWIDGTLAALDASAQGRPPRWQGTTIEGSGLPDFAFAPAVLDLAGGLAGSGIGLARAKGGTPTPLLDSLALWGAGRGFLIAVADAATGIVTLAGGTRDALWQGLAREVPIDAVTGTPLAPIAKALAAVFAGRRNSTVGASAHCFDVLCLHQTLSWDEAEPLLQAFGALEVSTPHYLEERRRRSLVAGFRLTPQQLERLTRRAKRGFVPPELEPVVTCKPSAAA